MSNNIAQPTTVGYGTQYTFEPGISYLIKMETYSPRLIKKVGKLLESDGYLAVRSQDGSFTVFRTVRQQHVRAESDPAQSGQTATHTSTGDVGNTSVRPKATEANTGKESPPVEPKPTEVKVDRSAAYSDLLSSIVQECEVVESERANTPETAEYSEAVSEAHGETTPVRFSFADAAKAKCDLGLFEEGTLNSEEYLDCSPEGEDPPPPEFHQVERSDGTTELYERFWSWSVAECRFVQFESFTNAWTD